MRRRKYLEVAAADERFKAFVPAPLPPELAIVWSWSLRRRFDETLLVAPGIGDRFISSSTSVENGVRGDLIISLVTFSDVHTARAVLL